MTSNFRTFAIALAAIIMSTGTLFSQEASDNIKVYPGGEPYEVTTYPHEFKSEHPKNIILIIGDGMGVAHVHAGLTANRGRLFLSNFKHVGFTTTHSASSYITDSAASATALATGNKRIMARRCRHRSAARGEPHRNSFRTRMRSDWSPPRPSRTPRPVPSSPTSLSEAKKKRLPSISLIPVSTCSSAVGTTSSPNVKMVATSSTSSPAKATPGT